MDAYPLTLSAPPAQFPLNRPGVRHLSANSQRNGHTDKPGIVYPAERYG